MTAGNTAQAVNRPFLFFLKNHDCGSRAFFLAGGAKKTLFNINIDSAPANVAVIDAQAKRIFYSVGPSEYAFEHSLGHY